MREVFELFKFIAMTFEQLLNLSSIAQERISEYEQEIQTIREGLKVCMDDYVREHLPFPFKKRQRVTVTLRVSEKTLACTRYRAGCAPVLGETYSKTGILKGYIIGEKGELRPDFLGKNGYYPLTDEVVSIKVADEQYKARCGTCRYYRDGGCYSTGGDKPVFATEQDAYICGYYRDKGE